MLLGQLWEKQGIRDPIPVCTYLFECPLSRLHGSKIQIYCLYKMKKAFHSMKRTSVSQNYWLALFWRKKNLLK